MQAPAEAALPVSKLATGNGTVTLSPVESAIASVAPAAPSSPPNGSAGRKLRPALPSHCVACGVGAGDARERAAAGPADDRR